MYITCNLIKSFIDDVSKLANMFEKEGYEDIVLSIDPCDSHMIVQIASKGRFPESEALALAEKFIDSWNRYSIQLYKKYEGVFNKGEQCTDVFLAGVDGYFASSRFLFSFGDKITKSEKGSALKYCKIAEELASCLRNMVTGCDFNIIDKGNYCSIDKYFRYYYATEELVPIMGNLNLVTEDLKKLQTLIKNLLLSLSGIGAPIKAVHLSVKSTFAPVIYDKDECFYFYSLGDECILMNHINHFTTDLTALGKKISRINKTTKGAKVVVHLCVMDLYWNVSL